MLKSVPIHFVWSNEMLTQTDGTHFVRSFLLLHTKWLGTDFVIDVAINFFVQMFSL